MSGGSGGPSNRPALGFPPRRKNLLSQRPLSVALSVSCRTCLRRAAIPVVDEVNGVSLDTVLWWPVYGPSTSPRLQLQGEPPFCTQVLIPQQSHFPH